MTTYILPCKPTIARSWTATDHAHSRHLLYAILRQVSILPDSLARGYLRAHTLSRWRTYSALVGRRSSIPTRKVTPNSSHNDLTEDVTTRDTTCPREVSDDKRTFSQQVVERWHTNLETARKSLRHLQEANAGHVDRLRKVLLLTYGRTGKRRHELLAPLLSEALSASYTTSSSGNSVLKDDRVNPASPSRRKSWKEAPPQLTPQMTTLLRSQISSSPSQMTRKNPRSERHLSPRLPSLNAWLRPLPVKRAQNMRIDWYHDITKRALPPLSRDDFERLRDLALGGTDGVKAERAKRISARIIASSARIPREKLDDSNLGIEDGVEALVNVLPIGRGFKKREIHANVRLTDSKVVKAWQYVFEQCCIMDWDTDKREWKVTWGKDLLAAHNRRLATLPLDHR